MTSLTPVECGHRGHCYKCFDKYDNYFCCIKCQTLNCDDCADKKNLCVKCT